MNSVEKVKAICKERKIAIYKLEKDLGYGNAYISQLKKGTFPDDRLVEIANYLGVTTDYLLGTEEKPATNEGSGLNLTEDELRLLERYRNASEKKKKLILLLSEDEK